MTIWLEIDARRTFAGGYTLFAAYTHSSAHTNAAIDYVPTLSMLGPQQSGPLAWDTPNRVLSWGWLPFLAPGFKKRWDFVYTARLAYGLSVHVSQRQLPSGGRSRIAALSQLSVIQSWAGMALSLSRVVFRTAWRH